MKPEYESNKFQCPHCSTLATQKWFKAYDAHNLVFTVLQHLYLNYRSHIGKYEQKAISDYLSYGKGEFENFFLDHVPNGFSVATCLSCNDFTVWVDKDMVYPKKTIVPPPNIDLNEDIKALYLEASSILMDSPRGAAALLRLALQKLLKQIGKGDGSINSDIKDLVSDGISSHIQKALDIVRVVGNNAVHPGQIDFEDNVYIAERLFGILNFIAEELISKPKKLESLYADIVPENSKEHIKQRDEI